MKKIIIFFFLVIAIQSKSQNLVMNPSFEDTIPCSIFQNLGTWQLQPTYWYSANNGTPDYFSSLYDPYCFTLPIPLNTAGYQNARTGNAYVGISSYSSPVFGAINRREYIGGTFSDTLTQGHNYCITFYVSPGESYKYVLDDMGMFLSTDSVVDYTINTNLSNSPQIENPSGNILNDTINWIQISGNFIAAGGEKYFTIGNFKNDANTNLDSLGNNYPTSKYISYYFIDDVSVTDCTVGISNINPATTQSKLYPNPTKQTQVYYTSTLAANQTGNLQVTDMLGNILATYTLNSGSNKITINTAAYAKGLYIVKVNVTGMAGESLKLVVQ